MPGPPPPNSDINPLAQLQATNAAVKGQADPKTIVTVANQAKSVDEATTNIQAIAHTGNMVKMYDALGGMDVSHQAQAWTSLNPAEQHSLQSLGYKPPNPEALSHAGAGGQHGGFWSDVLGGIARPFVDTAHVAEHAASDTLNALGSPLRAVQHVERAGNALAEIGMHQAGQSWAEIAHKSSSAGVDPTEGWNLVFSPHAWAQAWDMTNNGNTTLDPAQNKVLVGQYGQKQVSLAIQVSNQGPDAVIQAAPANQRQALINQVQDPKFISLVSQVGNAKVSMGRLAVGSQFMNQHPAAGKALSGTIDAANDILSDPTLKLGKVVEAAKIARWGASNATEAADLIRSSPGVQKYTQFIADHYLSQGRYGELGKVSPGLESVAADLQSQNIDTADKFREWLANGKGLDAVMNGDVAKQSHGVVIVPHLTYLGWMRPGVKAALTSTIDKLSDGKVPSIPLEGEDVLGAGDHTALGANDHRVDNFINLMEKGRIAGGYGKIPGISNVARLVRRVSTDIPTTNAIRYEDQFDENGRKIAGVDLTNFRRMLQGYLPSKMVDDASNLWLESNTAKRRLMIQAAIKQQAHAAGVFNTDPSGKAFSSIMDAIEQEDRKQAYGINGYDTSLDDHGLTQHHALYETQTSGAMRIVLPNTMRSLARSESILNMAGVHPMNVLDRGMMYWRTLVLDRPGFAVRVALDENLNRLIRLGPKGFAGSMLATGAAPTRTKEDIEAQLAKELSSGTLKEGGVNARRAALTAASYKQILPYHPVDRVLQLLADRAPEGARNNWKSIEEFYGGVVGANTRKFMRQIEGKGLKALGMQEYINGATHFAMHQQVAQDALQDVISHALGSPGFTLDAGSLVKLLRNGVTGKAGYWRKMSGFSQAAFGDPLYAYKWQASLDSIARSKLGQAVLHSLDGTRNDQIDSVLHVLNDPEFAEIKASLDRSTVQRDGSLVGGGATQDQVDRDFAESIVDNTNAHVRTGHYDPGNPGRVIQRLVDHMKEHGAGPDSDLLDEIIKQHSDRGLPESVVGPDLVPVSRVEGFLSHSFEELAGKPMNWLARQPHLIHQYTDALPAAQEMARKLGMVKGGPKGGTKLLAKDGELTKDGEQYASDIAVHRAVNAIIPYIHNPSLRTQFEDVHRNIFPFLFAQRQFLLRWGRTFADSPSGLRELQLGMNALRTTGIVKKDANGNDFFYYPGSQYVTEMVTHTLNRLGVHSTVPFAVPFTGEVKYLMPGLANPVTPSVGPFAAVGMKELARIFPELTGTNQAILGQGASESAWQQFLPSIGNRIYDAYIDKLSPNEAGSQLASAAIMMMKYMDANGQGLPQNARPGQIEQYVDRMTTGARDILLVRAALGFIMPATPTAQLDPQGLDKRYKELLQILPYDKALQQFYKEHPHAFAYTVGDTQGKTSGNLPSTQQDLAYTNQHIQFAKDYPAAFPWLAPRSPGSFSLTEFLEQESTGQRTALPVWDSAYGAKSALANIMNARASTEYYAAVDAYDKMYNSTTDPTVRKQNTEKYDQWKQSFLSRNPLFNEYLTTQTGKNDRQQTIRQVSAALNDPSLPASPAVAGLKDLVSAWDGFKAAYSQYLGNNTTASYDTKQSIKNQMISWGNDYIKSHPQVADFWNTILRPEVDETNTTIG